MIGSASGSLRVAGVHRTKAGSYPLREQLSAELGLILCREARGDV